MTGKPGAQELIVTVETDIAASAEGVWRMLTDPDLTERYMFGCRIVSDWKIGGSLLWQGTAGGRAHVFVKGTLLAVEPGRLLRYTTFAPDSGLPDVSENYLTVECRLTPTTAGKTHLVITQGDYARVANGQARYEENRGGSAELLAKMRSVAERG